MLAPGTPTPVARSVMRPVTAPSWRWLAGTTVTWPEALTSTDQGVPCTAAASASAALVSATWSETSVLERATSSPYDRPSPACVAMSRSTCCSSTRSRTTVTLRASTFGMRSVPSRTDSSGR
jgi:hypothetical protein